MWKLGLKNNVKVDKGDSIKNSNITIDNGNDAMIIEMYRVIGRLEGEFKGIKNDIKYIRKHIEEHDDKLKDIEFSLFRKVK